MKKPPPNAARILVVEDEPVSGALLREMLQVAGYTVEVETDGERGFARAVEWRPEVMITDVMLPKMHGIDLLRRLKQSTLTRDIGVIVCTARSYKTDVQQALALGAFTVLAKPVDRGELLGAVRRFLRREDAPAQRGARENAAAPAVIYEPQATTGRPFVRMWGTRGSIPVSGPGYIRHGGDTSCVEVVFRRDSLIIDAGSGIRALGQRLVKEGPRKLHLFITHTHWDHIQGFPFFAPLYVPGFEVVVYGASGFGKDLKSIFEGQVDRDYFPVQFEDMRAAIEFVTLTPEPVRVGGLSVTWEYTQHPQATVGYKIEADGRTLGYASDNEYLIGYHGDPREITMESEWMRPHRRLTEFLNGADLLVHEAQYTNAEYARKVRWGHSSVSNSCVLAKLSGAKRWVVTHHDPLHDDAFLDDKLNVTRQVLRELEYAAEVSNAFDGLVEYF